MIFKTRTGAPANPRRPQTPRTVHRLALPLVSAATVAVAGIPSNGLIGRWPLDGHFDDTSGHNHHGRANGVPTAITDGRFGGGFRFDGNDGINVGNLSDFASEAYTVCGWIRTTEPARTEVWRNWIAKPDGGRFGGLTWQLLIGDGRDFAEGANDANDAGFAVWNGGVGVVGIGSEGINLRDGEWHFMAATYAAGVQKLFVDGIVQGPEVGIVDDYPGPLPLGQDAVIIGGVAFGPRYHQPWIGDIDEVLIYDRALSDEEVLEIYAPNPASLTITADSLTKTYGAPISFAGTEFTAAGLQGTDRVDAVTLTSAGAAAGAGVGTYPIIPSAATGSFDPTRYLLTYVPGVLTVVPPPTSLREPVRVGGTFRVSLATVPGATYTLQWKNSLSQMEWTAAEAAAGTGAVVTLRDEGASDAVRVYRVKAE